MSILQQVSHSKAKQSGIRVVLAGVEKVGKTTTACEAPGALLVPLEVGCAAVSVNKVPMLTTWGEVVAAMNDFCTAAQAGQFPFRTIIFDSATALERLIHDATIAKDPAFAKGNGKAVTMESALGGYGKAYQYANEQFSNFTKMCDYLCEHGINIVFTSHVFASKVLDPQNGEYDSWDLLLHSPKNQKTYGKREMMTQWADAIVFMHEPLFITKGENMNQGVSANQGIVAGFSRKPGYVAGNRFGIIGECPLPKGNAWNTIAHAIYTCSGIDVYNRGN